MLGSVEPTNLDGGSIGANATIGIDVAGAITVQTDALLQLINTRSMGTVAASIGSDASVGISAGSLSAGSDRWERRSFRHFDGRDHQYRGCHFSHREL